MDLDRLSVVLRPRTYAEGVDLGFRMARTWWTAIVGPWLVVLLPLPCLGFVLLYDHPFLVFLAVWWLKPLYDRVPLFVISRAMFGEVPRIGNTLRALPGLFRRRALASLTLARFDPLRSFHMPIGDLEGLSGRALPARRRLLARYVQQEALMLTVVCALCEIVLALSPLVFIWMVTLPGNFGREVLSAVFEDGDPVWIKRLAWVVMACWLGAMTLVGPFYVGGGFGLYVNRRTLLEAWDIEFAFRRMARRLAQRARPAALWILAAFLAHTAMASDLRESLSGAAPAGSVDSADEERIRRQIEEILADPIFGAEHVHSFRRWRTAPDDVEPPYLGFTGAEAWLAMLFSRLLWVAAIGSVVYLVFRVAKNARLRAEPRSIPEAAEPPAEVAGLDVRASSLPADIPGEARRLWDGGDRAGAVRLLYRGALARMIAEGLPVRSSATEGDCLVLVKRCTSPAEIDRTRGSRNALPDRKRKLEDTPSEFCEAVLARRFHSEVEAYFSDLTHAWLETAYGHHAPSGESGPALIVGWKSTFGAVE